MVSCRMTLLGETLSHCIASALLTSKKGSTWRVCAGNCTINMIIIKYGFNIPRLDDL